MWYRYIVFINGKYGAPIPDAYINFCLDCAHQREDGHSYYNPPDNIKETFFGLLYLDHESFVTGLINTVVNNHVDSVLCFDNILCDLFVYKGNGKPKEILNRHISKISKFYEVNFEASFGYVNIFDRRR